MQEQKQKIVLVGDSTLDSHRWVGRNRHQKSADFTDWMQDLYVGCQPGKPQTIGEQVRDHVCDTDIKVVDLSQQCKPLELVLGRNMTDRLVVVDPEAESLGARTANSVYLDIHGIGIQDASQVFFSAGGNDILDFFRDHVFDVADRDIDSASLLNVYKQACSQLRHNYVVKLVELALYAPNAKIILLTQHYPGFDSVIPTFYFDFYPQLQKLGKCQDYDRPEDTIHAMISDIYSSVIEVIHASPPLRGRVSMVDVTSALNPKDPDNHYIIIEPSKVGAEKIAKMICHASNYLHQHPGKNIFFRFKPRFFKSGTDEDVLTTDFATVKKFLPVHPSRLHHKHRLRRTRFVLFGLGIAAGAFLKTRHLLPAILATLPAGASIAIACTAGAMLGLLVGYVLRQLVCWCTKPSAAQVERDFALSGLSADSAAKPRSAVDLGSPAGAPALTLDSQHAAALAKAGGNSLRVAVDS